MEDNAELDAQEAGSVIFLESVRSSVQNGVHAGAIRLHNVMTSIHINNTILAYTRCMPTIQRVYRLRLPKMMLTDGRRPSVTSMQSSNLPTKFVHIALS